MIAEKIAQFFEKVAKKCQKAKIESPKHLQQTT
jgi:hypothetical protein